MSQFFLVQMQVGVCTEDDDRGRGAEGGGRIDNIGKDETEDNNRRLQILQCRVSFYCYID